MGISVHLAVRRQSGDIASLNKRHIQHRLDALKHTFKGTHKAKSTVTE